MKPKPPGRADLAIPAPSGNGSFQADLFNLNRALESEARSATPPSDRARRSMPATVLFLPGARCRVNLLEVVAIRETETLLQVTFDGGTILTLGGEDKHRFGSAFADLWRDFRRIQRPPTDVESAPLSRKSPVSSAQKPVKAG